MANEKRELKVMGGTNAVLYGGNVIIKYLKGKKVVKTERTHNEGTEFLFRFLLDCLKGDFETSVGERPYWVIPFREEGGVLKYSAGAPTPITGADIIMDSEGQEALSYKIFISNANIGTNGMHGVLFYSSNNRPLSRSEPLSDEGVSASEDYSMRLYFNESHSEIKLDEGIDMLLLWQLKFVNTDDSKEGE